MDATAEDSPAEFLQGVVSSAAVPEEEGVAERVVPAGTWAVFHSEGDPPESAQYIWRDVFARWFPARALPRRARSGDPECPAVR
ncbi:GyrI-like domain-containing protein [Actinopolyspora mzabensis]|uniref:GyrI-like domain-containing protein n=1 Tax=Actinopolyspora mzabensis TaxID=995066 RepID=UPI0015A10DFD|nr:GyrI-like domain-containing protein [Actinopolyspora mzabensis]